MGRRVRLYQNYKNYKGIRYQETKQDEIFLEF